MKTCALCGSTTKGGYGIHRDGFGEGPEVFLCTRCGSKPHPTCESIWDCIRGKKLPRSAYQDPPKKRKTKKRT